MSTKTRSSVTGIAHDDSNGNEPAAAAALAEAHFGSGRLMIDPRADVAQWLQDVAFRRQRAAERAAAQPSNHRSPVIPAPKSRRSVRSARSHNSKQTKAKTMSGSLSPSELRKLGKRLDALRVEQKRLRKQIERTEARRALHELDAPQRPAPSSRWTAADYLAAYHAGDISKDHLLFSDDQRRCAGLKPILSDAERAELRGGAPACNVQRFSIVDAVRASKASRERTQGGAA